MIIEKLELLKRKLNFSAKGCISMVLTVMIAVVSMLPITVASNAYYDDDGDKSSHNGIVYSLEYDDYDVETGEEIQCAKIVGYNDSLPENVTIPEKIDGYQVSHISEAAFEDCTWLKSVTIPGTISYLSYEVFSGCTQLEIVTLKNGVAEIGGEAFSGCSSLKKITIPKSINSISEYAFSKCNNLESISVALGNSCYKSVNGVLLSADGKELIKYPARKSGSSYSIPSTVVTVSYAAFDTAKTLESVTVPNSVKAICEGAFYNAEKLKTIKISSYNSIEEFGSNAIDGTAYFKDSGNWKNEVLYCSNIAVKANRDVAASYKLKADTRCVADSAFQGCKNITENIFSDISGKIYLGKYSFRACIGMKNLTLGSNFFCARSAFYGCSGIETLNINTETVDGFSDLVKLRSVTLGDNVITVGRFSGCPCLTDLHIGKNVNNLDNYMFEYSENVNNITVDKANRNVYIQNGALYVKYCEEDEEYNEETDEYYFVEKNGIKLFRVLNDKISSSDFVVPEGVTDIVYLAFFKADKVTSVTVPESLENVHYSSFFKSKVTKIICNSESASFSNIETLKEISFGENVSKINSDVCYGCTGLTKIVFNENIKSIGRNAFSFCTGLLNVTIPKSVKTIDDSAFTWCTGIASIKIPDNVTSIGEYAFYRVNNVSYSPKMKATGSPWGAKAVNGYIKNDIVYNNSSMTELLGCPTSKTGSIIIPDSVTSIGDDAFEYCTGLTSITIPDSVTSISDCAFLGCSGIISITIPDSVTYIGNGAFDDVTSISYSSNMKASGSPWGAKTVNSYVEDGIVYKNSSKTRLLMCSTSKSGSVVIPDSVKSIDKYAFSGCFKLTSVTIPDSVTSIGNSAFYGCTGLTSITIPNSVTSIGNSAFYGCTGLTSITIPDSVTSIGNYTFRECTGLTSITIPDSVTSIGNYTFRECTGLTSITIPDSVTSIGEGAFCCCTGLTSLTIGNSVTSIGDDAFEYCTGLTSITIPDSVTHIGGWAFYSCSDLTSITIPDSVTSIGIWAFEECDNLTIYCVEHSYAHIYAKENDINYSFASAISAPTISISNVSSSGKIKIEWNAIDGAKEYQVYRATSKTGIYKLMKTTTATSYVNTSAVAGKSYYYKVKAVGTDGTVSDFSNIASRTCDLAKPVVKVSNVASSGKNKLTWNAVEGATKYQVYRATSKTGTYKLMKTTTDTSYVNSSAVAGKAYYYKVKAICSVSAADSAYSEIITRTCDLAKPVNVTASLNSSGKPVVKWNAVDGATGYRVYRSTSENGTYTLMKTVTDGTTYTNTSISHGITYFYKVKAICGKSAADSAYSPVISLYVK